MSTLLTSNRSVDVIPPSNLDVPLTIKFPATSTDCVKRSCILTSSQNILPAFKFEFAILIFPDNSSSWNLLSLISYNISELFPFDKSCVKFIPW